MEEHFNSMIQQWYQFPQMAGQLLLTYIGGGVKRQSKPPQGRTVSTSNREGGGDQQARDAPAHQSGNERMQSALKSGRSPKYHGIQSMQPFPLKRTADNKTQAFKCHAPPSGDVH